MNNARRDAFRHHDGFTVVETMIATGIGVVVLLAAASSFIATQRMLHTAMSESEQSLAARAERERLPVFRVYSSMYPNSTTAY